MGRSGGSGGRSNGGSFGGSRSSGGRSGGLFGGSSGRSGGQSGGLFGGLTGGGSFGGAGNSGGLFGKRKRSGGLFGNFPNSGRNPGRFGGGGFSGGGRSGGSGCGCGSLIVLLIVIAIVAVLIMSGMFSMFSGPNNANDSTTVTASTIKREPLPAGSVNETSYFTDELGWINNQTQLTAGLKNFYQQTGVQPHLYITDNVNGSHSPSTTDLDLFANNLYDQLFTDEAHLLLVFFEYNESYMTRYVAGTQAKTVIDSEAADILLDYFDRYYYDDSLSDEVYFSKAFNDAADRIMNVERSPWIPVLVVIGLASLALILFVWWRNMKKQKNLEAEQREEMLNTPLEKYEDIEMEKLEKRYEEPDDDPDQ